METRRLTLHTPLLAVAFFALLLAIYVSGFYLLGSIGTSGPARFHVYRYEWLSLLFTPAAQVESFVLQREVYAVHPVTDEMNDLPSD